MDGYYDDFEELDSHFLSPEGLPISEQKRFPKPDYARIWAIASGKGGVGKSFVSANLAIAMAQKGNQVLAVDLDFGGANLHSSLGTSPSEKTLSDFLTGKAKSLEDCCQETPIPNLKVIQGTLGSADAFVLSRAQRAELVQLFKLMPFDTIIFDLGAGTGANVIEFFLQADTGITVFLPEPTSIENGYRFLKGVYYDYLSQSTSDLTIQKWIKMASGNRVSSLIKSPGDLFSAIKKHDPEEYLKLKSALNSFNPFLIVNQTRTESDRNTATQISIASKRYFGAGFNPIGSINYDSTVWQSVRKRTPFILDFPNSNTSHQIESIASKLATHYAKAESYLW